MHRHGFAHALGYLICSLLAGIAVDLLKRYYPKFIAIAISVAARLSSILDHRVSPRALVATLTTCLLMFIWGAAYKLVSRR